MQKKASIEELKICVYPNESLANIFENLSKLYHRALDNNIEEGINSSSRKCVNKCDVFSNSGNCRTSLLNETLTAKMSDLQRTLSSCASSQSTLSLLQSLDHLR